MTGPKEKQKGPSEFDDFRMHVKVASTRLLGITGTEHARLAALRSSIPLVESVALEMLRHMAVVARAQSLIGEAPCLPQNAHNPATSMSRLVTENLVYLNYLLVEDTEWRARVFIERDDVFRERFVLDCGGEQWHRRHGGKQQLPPSRPAVRALRLGVTHDSGRVDEFEAAWIFRGIDHLADTYPDAMRGLVSASGMKYETMADVRRWWNELGSRIKHKAARDDWSAMCNRWNRLPKWSFGLRPAEAAREGRLTEQVHRIAQEDDAAAAGTTAQVSEWIERVGLDLGSDWTHFSPARVFLGGPGFTDPTWATTDLMLVLATRLLDPRFSWTTQIREAVG